MGLRGANRATVPPGHKPTEGCWVPHPGSAMSWPGAAAQGRHGGTILLAVGGGAKESEPLMKVGATQFAAKQKGGKS